MTVHDLQQSIKCSTKAVRVDHMQLPFILIIISFIHAIILKTYLPKRWNDLCRSLKVVSCDTVQLNVLDEKKLE